MKIDADSIEHNAYRLIKDISTTMYDILSDTGDDNLLRVETIGEVRGIIMLAEELKEALKQ